MNSTVTSVDPSEERPTAHIFIGNMSYQTRESELKDCVEKLVGKIADVHIVFRYNRSLGYGFVTFEDESNIEKAMQVLKEHELDGRRLNVQKCTPRSERPVRSGERRRFPARQDRFVNSSRKPRGPPSETMIYVGNLPFNMTTDDLKSMFEEYKISSCYVVTRSNGSSKGFGFVHTENHDEQQKILTEMAGATCDDRRLNIRAATSEGPYGTAEAEH